MKKFSTLVLLLLSLTAIGSVSAATTTEQYGTLLSGSFQPTKTFAALSVTGNASNTIYNFTLTANNLNSIFNAGAFIGSIAVNTNTNILPTLSNLASAAAAPVSVKNGGGPTGQFDFRFDLFQGQNRLTARETVSWTATFAQPTTFIGDQFALHVQGLTPIYNPITRKTDSSAWYTDKVVAAPVPEPETYALMLMGLGLVGFMAKRKNA